MCQDKLRTAQKAHRTSLHTRYRPLRFTLVLTGIFTCRRVSVCIFTVNLRVELRSDPKVVVISCVITSFAYTATAVVQAFIRVDTVQRLIREHIAEQHGQRPSATVASCTSRHSLSFYFLMMFTSYSFYIDDSRTTRRRLCPTIGRGVRGHRR